MTINRLILINDEQSNEKVAVIFNSHQLSIIIENQLKSIIFFQELRFDLISSNLHLKSIQGFDRKWHLHTILRPSDHSPDAKAESN